MSTNSPEDSTRSTIDQHEGRKYLRRIYPANKKAAQYEDGSIEIDVYCVLKAFNVSCPAAAHAIKKLLSPGKRGKGDVKADLIGAIAAINRAIDLSEEDIDLSEEEK